MPVYQKSVPASSAQFCHLELQTRLIKSASFAEITKMLK
nr:MAG TPA: hypothetical protein [Bacteriophage sp.]